MTAAPVVARRVAIVDGHHHSRLPGEQPPPRTWLDPDGPVDLSGPVPGAVIASSGGPLR